MTELNPSRHRWSWRSCFTAIKNKKKKSKKQLNHQLNSTFSNGLTDNKRLMVVETNAKILSQTDLQSSKTILLNDSNIKTEHDNYFDQQNDHIQQIVNSIHWKIFNQKSLSAAKPTPLDAIVEDSSEENIDEIDELEQSIRLCNDRDLVKDSSILHSRLFDLSKMNHIVTQFNDHGYFLGEFTYQLNKLKLKIDDIKRVSMIIPYDDALLEAKYSTLLSTIECLSLLLKVAQISSSRSFLNRLMFSIEERIEQLNKLIQLSSSINIYSKQQDLTDDDLPSFRSALSSYEQLSTIY